MQEWVGKTVVFTKRIEEMEAYPEAGMRAKIVSISSEDTDSAEFIDHMYRIQFDYSDYDNFNRLLETANYYGQDGVPNKTARAAGYYDVMETIYFGAPELYPFSDYFVPADQDQQALIEMFSTSGEKTM